MALTAARAAAILLRLRLEPVTMSQRKPGSGMVRRRGMLFACLLLVLAGCAGGPPARGGSWLDRLCANQAALTAGGVLIDVVVLELPAGDPFLNDELWEATDEHLVPLEQKAVLEENGFRVGQVVGAPPRRLQKLLGSDRCCVSRWRQVQPAGRPVPLAASRTAPALRYRVAEHVQPVEVELEQAQAFLIVVPSLTADGRTALRFTPQVQHGEVVPDFQVAPDRSGRTLSYRRQRQTYEGLGWKVTLAPNEYVVLGCAPDRPESLGHACFAGEDGGRPVQRLMVIRTARPPASDAEEAEGGSGARPPAPLAVQTNWGGAP
jgi:hypothetical protein